MVAFAATNVDDVVLLAIFFARRDDRFGTRQIVAGQYLGFAFLLVVSWAIGSRAVVERAVERAGAYAVPIVLIALGVLILAGVG